MNNSVPALVLNCEAHGGLGIVRSLGRMGVSVYPVHKDRSAPANFSRHAKGMFRWDFVSTPASDSLNFLSWVRKKIGKPALLFACDDDTAIFVSKHAESLRGAFLFHELPEGMIAALASKRGLYALAKQHNCPTAESKFPQSRAEVLSFLPELRFPALLKGIDGLRLSRKTGKRMVICSNERELLTNYDRLEEPQDPNLIVQEYIPGGADSVWMFNGYFNAESECLVSYTGRKLRQCPIRTGATSLGICLRNAEVESSVAGFLTAIGYKGMVDVDTRYDARTGTYKVLDVNPRIGATFRLFVDKTGMDVARAFYLDMTGQQVMSLPVHEGRKWIVEDMDVSASLRYRGERTLSFRQWAASLRGIEEAGYFSWTDPLPAMVRMGTFLRRVTIYLARKLKTSRPTLWPAKPRTSNVATGLSD